MSAMTGRASNLLVIVSIIVGLGAIGGIVAGVSNSYTALALRAQRDELTIADQGRQIAQLQGVSSQAAEINVQIGIIRQSISDLKEYLQNRGGHR